MSEPPASQEMDLRSELQSVQQRMKKTEAIGNSLQQAAKELEDHIKHQNGSTSDEQGQLLKQKLSSLQDEYDQIIKDGQLLSKPSVSTFNFHTPIGESCWLGFLIVETKSCI